LLNIKESCLLPVENGVFFENGINMRAIARQMRCISNALYIAYPMDMK